jgi:hypothetical protein
LGRRGEAPLHHIKRSVETGPRTGLGRGLINAQHSLIGAGWMTARSLAASLVVAGAASAITLANPNGFMTSSNAFRGKV